MTRAHRNDRCNSGATIPPSPSGSAKCAVELFSDSESQSAEQIARFVISGFGAGTKHVIHACIAINKAVLRFRNSRDTVDRFIAELVKGFILPASQAHLGLSIPKLSMLGSIGDHGDILLREGICEYLVPHPSTLYEVVLLYKRLLRNVDALAKCIALIYERDGELTADAIAREAKPKKHNTPQSNFSPATTGQPDGQTLGVCGHDFDLLVATPSLSDIRRLSDVYANSTALAECLQIRERIAAKAIAFVAVSVKDFPTIAHVLLPLCGFSRVSRIVLASMPTHPDVSDVAAIILAERGQDNPVPLPSDLWQQPAELVDILTLAARIAPNASNKLHIFAAENSQGWHSLIGDQTWAERPSLR